MKCDATWTKYLGKCNGPVQRSHFQTLLITACVPVLEDKQSLMEVKQEGAAAAAADAVQNVVDISSSPDATPIRPVPCLKEGNIEKIRQFEEIEDCFILDFDPSEIETSLEKISNLSLSSDKADLSIVSEKGQVACRDYPHSRHLCIKYPFDKTPHESYCELCYCYVCDSSAPCEYWKDAKGAHCNASDKIGDWNEQRRSRREQYNKLPN